MYNAANIAHPIVFAKCIRDEQTESISVSSADNNEHLAHTNSFIFLCTAAMKKSKPRVRKRLIPP